MADRLANVLLGILALCAVVVTSLVVRREFGRASAQDIDTSRLIYAPRLADSTWHTVSATGRLRGNPNAPVKIVVFSDYQCPGCRMLASELEELRAKYPTQFSVRTHYYPLEAIHPFARQAATAAECAARAGRFAAYDSLLFHNVASFPESPWLKLAVNAGIQDTSAFRNCLKSSVATNAINADTTLGASIPVRATPTVLINGLAFRDPPSEPIIEGFIQKAQ